MWVIAEVIDSALCCVIAYYLGLPAGVSIFVITITPILLCHISTVLARSKLVVKKYVNESWDMVKCPHCTIGMQFFHTKDEQWGPIPIKVRMAQKGSFIFHPPQANVRSCHNCSGSGWIAGRTAEYLNGDVEDELKPTEWPYK